MDEKLKKIALKLSKNFKRLTLKETFYNFLTLVKNQQDYFSNYKRIDLIKITFYIYSLNQTGDYKWAESTITNCHIGNFFEFEKDRFETVDCDDCGGDGAISCLYCGGTGEVQCDTCDGDGEVECDDCDGSGEDEEGNPCDTCQGGGFVRCDNCDGSKYLTCRDCNGNTSESCGNCDGDGVVETSKLLYQNTTFLVWDKKLIDMFRNSYELERPMAIQDDFIPYENQDFMVIVNNQEDSAEFHENVKPDTRYCFFFAELIDSSLYFNKNNINTGEEPDEYTY
jgi:hypothetical protein